MKAPKKCGVGPCPNDSKKHGLCVVHALTWLLTPDADVGPQRERGRSAFISRQEARHALKGRTT